MMFDIQADGSVWSSNGCNVGAVSWNQSSLLCGKQSAAVCSSAHFLQTEVVSDNIAPSHPSTAHNTSQSSWNTCSYCENLPPDSFQVAAHLSVSAAGLDLLVWSWSSVRSSDLWEQEDSLVELLSDTLKVFHGDHWGPTVGPHTVKPLIYYLLLQSGNIYGIMRNFMETSLNWFYLNESVKSAPNKSLKKSSSSL